MKKKFEYSIFLDDERHPPDKSSKLWKIARTYQEAVNIVEEHGFPNFVSFDHDLGEEKTGFSFAQYLVNRDLDKHDMPSYFQWCVHSQNPVGRDNINNLLNNYMEQR